MGRIRELFEPNILNAIRWCWSFAAAIAVLAWLDGQGVWALVAAFSALVIVLLLHMKPPIP